MYWPVVDKTDLELCYGFVDPHKAWSMEPSKNEVPMVPNL